MLMTGDYRGATFGPFGDALEGMKRLRPHLRKAVYGVLGNHDTIRMAPGLEDMGIRILLNECEHVSRDGESIYLAGIDDAHFYQVDNIEKAAANIPAEEARIGESNGLLKSHSSAAMLTRGLRLNWVPDQPGHCSTP
jgi:hypothetical protein